MSKLKAGNKVYESTPQGPKALTVEKVGRKYFYVRFNHYQSTVKFNLESFVEVKDWGSPKRLYRSEQEIADSEDNSRISERLRSLFGRYGSHDVTLDQLRRIEAILDEPSTT